MASVVTFSRLKSNCLSVLRPSRWSVFLLAASLSICSASGQLTTIAPTFANWNRYANGAWSETLEGLQFNGSGSRLGNVITTKEVYDLTDAEVYVKWKAHGGGYMGVSLCINPLHITAGLMTTDHSWAGSKVVSQDVWYYSRFRFSGDTNWTVSTCTGSYDNSGGTVFLAAKGSTGTNAFWVKSSSISLLFGDNYGGAGAYLVAGEVKTSGQKLKMSPVFQHGFEDGLLPANMTVQGERSITTTAYNSEKALKMLVSTGDGFTLGVSNVVRVSFDINHTCNDGISFFIDNLGGESLVGAGAGQWYHVDLAVPSSGMHLVKLVVYSGAANGTYMNNGKTIILDNLVLWSEGRSYALTVAGGTGDGQYDAGKEVTVAADAPAAGWTFARWTVQPEGTSLGAGFVSTQPNTTIIMPVGDVTLTAVYQGAPCVVTFDPEAGTVGQPSKTVTNGLAYGTLPVPLLEHYTFEGWWTGEGGTGALVTAGTTVSNASDHALHAKWAGVASTVTFSAQGGTVDPALKVVNFGSAYGVLPSPVWTGSLFGGWWTEAGGVGAQVSSGTVVAAAANHTLYAKWTANEAVDWQASLGAAFGLALSDAFTGPAKVTVTGLPAGLTYNTATRTIEGSPSKLGTFTVTVAMEGAETKTFAIDVKPLPAWAQGSFSGHVEGGGLATMSVAASGKITGKIVVPGASYSFSAKSYASGDEEGGFAVLADVKAGATVLKLELLVTGEGQPETPGVASGTLDGETGLTLWRDVWKESAAATLLPLGYYTATLPGGGDCGSGYLTFTVDKTGKFKTAGKLADGTAVSLSGTLALDGSGRLIAVLYTAPGGYGGGCFFGLVEFVRPAGGGAVFLRPLDGSELRWESLNPQATESYGDGFARTLRLVGGLYDKLASLQTYYSGGLSVGVSWTPPALPIKRKVTDYNWDYPMPETDSEVERLPPKITSSEPDMAPDAGVSPGGLELTVNDAGTAISAPKSPAPSKMLDEETRQFFGEYNYGELVNPSGLTFTFAKATGLFKGAFNVYYDYVSAVDATKEENGETFAHVVKKVSFEGALTPVRGDTSDGVGGRGFFLWAAKGAYDTGKVDRDDNPVMKEYPLNLSYDFKLQ